MNQEEKAILEGIKKDALGAIVKAEGFAMVYIENGDVKLIRGVRDGRDKLTMVGALSLAAAVMNAETLSEGGVTFTDNNSNRALN